MDKVRRPVSRCQANWHMANFIQCVRLNNVHDISPESLVPSNTMAVLKAIATAGLRVLSYIDCSLQELTHQKNLHFA